MSKTLCLIDTSVFVNLMNVPNRNQLRAEILDEYELYIADGYRFFLPMATVLETGNHIAQNGDGTVRRKTAQRFVNAVKDAFEGNAPYELSAFPETAEVRGWLDDFPDLAGRNKSEKKKEGTSFGDLTIIKEFERFCLISPTKGIFIWSLDADLKQYHQKPSI